jgi:PAS domain S-box-containing protein
LRWPRVIRHASFWSGISLFVVVGAFSYRSLSILTESNQSVDHTQTVLVAIAQLGSVLTVSETAQRGYIIASDPGYLQLYEQARAQVPESIGRLRSLIQDNEGQQRRLDAMEPLIAERLALLAKHIAQRETAGLTALDPAEFGRGKVLMDAIYRALDDMRDDEHRLYNSRARTAARQARLTSAADAIGTIGGVLILGTVFFWMNREVRSRQRAEATLNTLNEGLEARVRERTALLEAEVAERRRVDETLRAVIEESPFAIIGLAGDRTVMIWNRAAERIFGYTADETLNRPYPLVPPEGQAEFDRIFQRSAAGERLRNVPVRRRRKDGALVDIVFSGAPLYDADRRLRGIVFVLEDVTARKALEQQLRQAQKMEAIGQLTGGIAHDFNNLLGVIIGSLDLLREREADGESAELAQEALAGALRGAELTRRMLAFARRQPLQPRIVDLNDTLPGITEMLRRTLGEDIIISTSPAGDLWPALADPSQVEDAILNLAVNARDAMPNGGRLIIETANARLDENYAAQHSEVVPGDYVMLSVTDSGTGMPAEVIERAFEPFFTTKEAGRGTGLGLSMVYGFIKQSGGHVKIYSEPGHGTTVKLYLPKATDGTAAPTISHGPVEHPVGNEMVLVVEDDAKLRSVALKLLRDLGYRVREADSAKSALAVLSETDEIDVLFTDVVMPNGTGYDLARKAREQHPRLKILFTSGYSEHLIKNGDAAELGAYLITKPYRKQELAVKLRSVLEDGLC